LWVRKLQVRGRRSPDAGFTLIELLVSITIIGLMSSIGLVAYSTIRSRARDAKRLADIRQVQTAIEIFFESNSYYPSDYHHGVAGLVIGQDPRSEMLSDAGFTQNEPSGLVYMVKLPSNPEPYGAPYVYRSLNRDGTDCTKVRCDSYVLLFWLERGQGDFSFGPHSLSPIGTVADDTGYDGQDVIIGGSPEGVDIEEAFDRYATETVRVVQGVRSDATVQEVAEKAVAPTVGVMAVVNTVAATGSQLYHLFFFLLQPFQLLRRRRNQAWGIVYDSLSHLPEDLAIVRLQDSTTKRIVKSAVTDVKGRYSFLVGPGSYLLTVSKVGRGFPSEIVKNVEKDGAYENVYDGGIIVVDGEGAVIAPNIPVDPPEVADTVSDIKSKERRGKWQRGVATAAFGFGVIAFGLNPTMLTGLLLAAQVVVYMLFNRLAEPEESKTWGVVFDSVSEKPVPKAFVRIFEGKYNKLLETQITDRSGRYHFRVGQNVYYITVSKPGYLKTETNKLDLTGTEGATVIASDLPLQRDKGHRVPVEPRSPEKTGKSSLLVPPGGKESGAAVKRKSPESNTAAAAVGKAGSVGREGGADTVSIDLILPQMARQRVELDDSETGNESDDAQATEPTEKLSSATSPKPEEAVSSMSSDEGVPAGKDSPKMPDPYLISPSQATRKTDEPQDRTSRTDAPGAVTGPEAGTEAGGGEVPLGGADGDGSGDDDESSPPKKAWFRD